MDVARALAALTEEVRPPLDPADVLLEADRCLACGSLHATAPCVVACPAGVDVPTFVRQLAAGDAIAAGDTVLAANLLGATCARVCAPETMCEGACVMLSEGRPPVPIAALQRRAADAALAAGSRRATAASTGRQVAVVGAGPAGLACAGELALLGHEVTVYDDHEEIGGLVRYAIAPYREQRDPLPAERALLERYGVRFALGAPVPAQALADADAVFLGAGLGGDVEVDLPGDDLPGVYRSLPFIEALKTGAPPEVGTDVVVLGGGNTAMDVAREAVRLGAERVTVAYRRTRREMPAFPLEVEEAEEEGVRFQWLSRPVRFLGTHRVEGVELQLMNLSEPDESGRRRPVPVAGSEFVLRADTVVEALGQQARAELLELVDGLAFEGRELVVDPETGQTGNPRVFAGGDVTNGGSTVVEAVREGKRAARAIDRSLQCAS
jgi:glutamate synthase (NADPH/NADH) small chain